MECNREEAIRAKNIAESRMQSKDFEGAQKIAVKAQRLFPDLESISQILAVCEVHCAAGTKIGGEIDWYAVLQVEMTADKSTIRKQYRKLALLLHPDKNKLAGAEGAFQLVGDAYKILFDPSKRSQHDMIRRANFSSVSLNQASWQSYRPSAKKQPGPGVSSTSAKSSFAHFGGMNQNQPSPFLGGGAFWTMCPSCSLRFQYYQNVLNKQVRCQKCFNRFVAYDLKTQGVPTTGNSKKVGNTAPFTGQTSDCVDASTSTMQFQRAKSDVSAFNQASKPEHSPEFFGESKSNIRDAKVDDDLTKCNDVKFRNVQLRPIHNGDRGAKPLASQKRSRNKDNRTAEPSVENASNLLRRSKRHKQNVTCNEVQGAYIDSMPPASKRSRKGEKHVGRVQNNNAFPRVVADGEREENENSRIHPEFHESVASRCNTSVDSENLTYPAPEFYNFESERCEKKFDVDQIWALYDNIDGMPRFYARVRKVYCREFKLQLSWLENDPRSIAEMKWSEQGLPVACGSFKLGKSYNTQERQIFSHLVPWGKGTRRNSLVIYPRRGEIWALFKNWDIRWSSEPDNHRVYEYQIVEVVSDFTEVAGISVIRLANIKEFMALFVRAVDAEESLLEIPAKDVLMFSHMIPACRMTGKEGNGVPEGAFELDCASLPTNFKATFPSISLESSKPRALNVDVVCNNGCINPVTSENKIPQPTMGNGFEHINSNGSQDASQESQKDVESENMILRNEVCTEADNLSSQNPNSEHHSDSPILLAFEYPESEFYDFESDRLMEKFECGQVWAFYCEIDNFPKYYGRIRMVDRENNQVRVRWLEVCSALNEDDLCAEDKPPPACGAFRAIKETCSMGSHEAFSHQVKVKPMEAKDRYLIFPDAGEVWAVFRNWTASCSASDLRNSEFDIVEISAFDDSGIKALVLTKVSGYVSVFSREIDGHEAIMLIPVYETSRFSHQIPAYQLKNEMGSNFWELDPAAVPTVYLTSKS